MTGIRLLGAAVFALALAPMIAPSAGANVRIKDLGYFEGVRPNQLIGYGLVVGLDGTGDTERAGFTPQALEAMLSRMGVRIQRNQIILRNVAAVMVTASLPPFARPGAAIDVTVSSIGDARSLRGGTLLMTPLVGADGETYAVSQGSLKVGSDAERDRRGYYQRPRLNAGRIPNGALVEREVRITLGQDGVLRYLLSRPDFRTAMNIADAINRVMPVLMGLADAPIAGPVPIPGEDVPGARLLDSGVIEITAPEAWEERIPAFVAEIEQLLVSPDTLARVVVNGRTGAVVLGGHVRLSQVAIAYEGLTIEVDPPTPPPVGAGPDDPMAAAAPLPPRQVPAGLRVVEEGTTLADVVAGLNALGVSAQELVDILEALSASGALHARLEVQ